MTMEPIVFAINPGSTSTKAALFKGGRCVFEKTVRHGAGELDSNATYESSLEYRLGLIRTAGAEAGIDFSEVDAFAGRGGLLKPMRGGTYIVGERMLEDLANARYGEHASNFGAAMAYRLARQYGKPAYIVDPPTVDELMEEARISGLPSILRRTVFHALNQKASALHASKDAGIDYYRSNLIVAHMGGGITVGAHSNGRVIDVNNGLEEGPFTPERAGSLPTGQLVELCFSGDYTREEIKKLLVGRGGLMAYTGTTDVRELVEKSERDGAVRTVLDAMIYGISREICACAAALCGKVDRVVITGGLAHSDYIVRGILGRIGFLGPVSVLPGEDEMAALAEGASRVLEGREEAFVYE